MTSQIGAQLYTIRDFIKTPEDIAKSLARVRKIGYEVVQVSAMGKIDDHELAKILKNEGLTAGPTHTGLDMMKDTQRCVDYHKAIGSTHTAIGGFGWKEGTGVEEWEKFAEEYSAVGKTLAQHGIHIGYHNHSHEWAPFPAGSAYKNPYELLMKKLDPCVWMEVDTYWVAHAGGDPAQYLEDLGAMPGNRLPAIHVKDMAITPKREQKMCEVGSGNLNWERILDVARKAHVKWYLVERDHGELDPFDSLKISFEFLRSQGLK